MVISLKKLFGMVELQNTQRSVKNNRISRGFSSLFNSKALLFCVIILNAQLSNGQIQDVIIEGVAYQPSDHVGG